MLVCLAIYATCIIAFPFAVGELITMITKLQKEDTIYEMKIDNALSVMIFLDLDFDLTNEIKDYYKVTEIKKEIMD
jgi:hypothetical protein